VIDGPRYLVTLRPVRDAIHSGRERPVTIRLRLLLKVALRSYGLRAEAVEEISTNSGGRPEGAGPHARLDRVAGTIKPF
jgi:hypothetical protein